GERIARGVADRIDVLARKRVADVERTKIVVGHRFRLGPGGLRDTGLIPRRPHPLHPKRRESPHLVWRLDPKQRQPRRENGYDALYEHETRHSRLSVILDNET